VSSTLVYIFSSCGALTTSKMDPRRMGFKNPFSRPWMENSSAAAAVGGSSVGLKGIVAGK
jgi:hypothetical protein